MNGEKIVDEIIKIVNSAQYVEERDTVLDFANQAGRSIAANILLPDLADGFDTVDTVIDDFKVAVPVTYHRGLFMAMWNGEEIDVYEDIKSMSIDMKGIKVEDEDITGVTVNGRSLIYQCVPATIQTIQLFYYRKPVDIADSTRSYADGATDNENYDWAIIYSACKKIYSRIEDGMEGVMINTQKYTELYAEQLGLLDTYARKIGQSFPKRPFVPIQWPGEQ